MIYFHNKQKGYSAADPSSFVGFEAQPATLILMALALAGMTELPATRFRERCTRVLLIKHPDTKSAFTRSTLKDNLRKLIGLCKEAGDSGVIAWE